MKGENNTIIFVDIKWIDQRAIEYKPILIYLLFLNESIIPVINPTVNVNRIVFL